MRHYTKIFQITTWHIMTYHDILWHSHDSWHIMTKGIQWLSLMPMCPSEILITYNYVFYLWSMGLFLFLFRDFICYKSPACWTVELITYWLVESVTFQMFHHDVAMSFLCWFHDCCFHIRLMPFFAENMVSVQSLADLSLFSHQTLILKLHKLLAFPVVYPHCTTSTPHVW